MPLSVKISLMPTRRKSGQDSRVDVASYLDSWTVALQAERKSPETIKSYTVGVRQFLDWCADEGTDPVLDRRTVSAFTVSLFDRGLEPTSVRARQLSLKRFSAWLADPDEGDVLERDELVGLKPPKLDTKVTPSLTDDQLKDLLKACKGRDLRDRRDEAIVRLMAETGARAGEVVNMTVNDVDLLAGKATVRRGKGGKGRVIPFSPQCARALDRYIRARRAHRLSDTSPLWVGDRGKAFSYDALHKTLKWRASLAGIEEFWPHLLRHTAASRWLAAGGSEGGLMAVAGWTRREMLDRYTRATSEARAADEARRLGLGEI